MGDDAPSTLVTEATRSISCDMACLVRLSAAVTSPAPVVALPPLHQFTSFRVRYRPLNVIQSRWVTYSVFALTADPSTRLCRARSSRSALARCLYVTSACTSPGSAFCCSTFSSS